MPENKTDTRGIQNARARGVSTAETRYEELAENRQLRTKLLNKEGVRAENDTRYEASNDAHYTQRGSVRSEFGKIQAVQNILKKLSGESGIPYDTTDATLLIKEPPQQPNFPYIMVSITILKDILDVPIELSIIGIVVTTILSFLLAIIIFIWILGKLSGGWWKKAMIRWLWIRYVFAILIEFLPFFKIIPATTILVLMAHYRETKIVMFFNAALEEFRKKKIPGL